MGLLQAGILFKLATKFYINIVGCPNDSVESKDFVFKDSIGDRSLYS